MFQFAPPAWLSQLGRRVWRRWPAGGLNLAICLLAGRPPSRRNKAFVHHHQAPPEISARRLEIRLFWPQTGAKCEKLVRPNGTSGLGRPPAALNTIWSLARLGPPLQAPLSRAGRAPVVPDWRAAGRPMTNEKRAARSSLSCCQPLGRFANQNCQPAAPAAPNLRRATRRRSSGHLNRASSPVTIAGALRLPGGQRRLPNRRWPGACAAKGVAVCEVRVWRMSGETRTGANSRHEFPGAPPAYKQTPAGVTQVSCAQFDSASGSRLLCVPNWVGATFCPAGLTAVAAAAGANEAKSMSRNQ